MSGRAPRTAVVFLCLLLQADVVHGDHAQDHITAATIEATNEWAATRGCRVTPNGVKWVVMNMKGTANAFEEKRVKFALSPQEETMVIKGAAQAYLDQASVQEFGSLRKGCVVNEAVLTKFPFPPAAKNPDTGILDIDGSERGADIFIDGDKKGNIRQAFILSIGDHTWKTMKCEESVQVSPQVTKKVYCSKK